MIHYPDPILKLISSFSRLPGVGKKTAERFALHLLHAPNHEAEELAAGIIELKNKIQLCEVCYALSDQRHCKICSDPDRDRSTICVVENPTDMVAIEKSNSFKGTYHILGGVLSALEGIGPEDIRLQELFKRAASKATREIIIATKTNVEGEATAAYIQHRLKKSGLKLSRIASGIPMGSDLQYIDRLTMQQAIQKRYEW